MVRPAAAVAAVLLAAAQWRRGAGGAGGGKSFPSLDAANRFYTKAGRQDLRICGLNAFAPQQGRLVLPRLEWRRCGGRAVMRLVLHSDLSLRDDAVTAGDFLASLTTAGRPTAACRRC